MAAGMPRRDPRDSYTLYIHPDSGPVFWVTLDMTRVKGAPVTTSNPWAEVNEVIRQIGEDAARRNIDIRGLDLQRHRERLMEALRFMGRMARVDGIVYRVAGSMPDPVAEARRATREVEEEWMRRLNEQRASDDRARRDALDHQRAGTEGQIQALHTTYQGLLSQAFTQRDQAMEIMLRDVSAQRKAAESGAHAETSAMAEEARQANLRLGAMEQNLRKITEQRDALDRQLQDAAATNVELQKLRKDNEILRERLKKAREARESEPETVTVQPASFDGPEPLG